MARKYKSRVSADKLDVKIEQQKESLEKAKMKQSALRSVIIFQKRGIGLDYYKSKEFMSRVVVTHYKQVDDKLIIMRILKDWKR